jgi:hypothetical protein
LEDETWLAADISFEFYEVFFFLLGLKMETQSDNNLMESQLDESAMVNNSMLQGSVSNPL